MIHLRALSLTYPGPARTTVQALQDIHLHVAQKDIFGIIGRSGAGKSSLVRCINLLNRPTTGQVVVDGQDLMQLPEARLRAARHKIGMVFQHFNLLSSRTVFDNVALPLEFAGMPRSQIVQRVMPLLELVGLAHLARRYPAQISGGQKQRVGIARALASSPKVLLSDEATSALDPETTRSILDLLRRVNRELGVTIVLITHQMQVIKQIADVVAVMDGGRIVERGPVLDVFTRPQQDITRSLIDEIIPHSLPVGVVERARRLAGQQARQGHASSLLRLLYGAQMAEGAVLSYLIRDLGLDVHILHGQMDDVQGQPLGSMAVLLGGPPTALHTGIEHLRSLAASVETVPLHDPAPGA